MEAGKKDARGSFTGKRSISPGEMSKFDQEMMREKSLTEGEIEAFALG